MKDACSIFFQMHSITSGLYVYFPCYLVSVFDYTFGPHLMQYILHLKKIKFSGFSTDLLRLFEYIIPTCGEKQR